jgi:chromosome segregation ATPase
MLGGGKRVNDVDTTMQAFLGVYREDVNQLEARVEQLEGSLADANRRENAASMKVSHLVKDAETRNKQHGKAEGEHAAKVEKLQGVIESLKLDLASEREALTKLRDSIGPKPMPGTSA